MSEPKFKLNDQVFVCRGFRDEHKTLTYIERVTPSGLLGVRGQDGLFREDGRKRGDYGWRRPYIIHATEERKAAFVLVRAQRKAKDLVSHNVKRLTADQCRQIIGWLDATEKEQG